MAKGQNLPDPLLNALRQELAQVAIYLVNSIKLQGQIESFAQFVVLLKNSISQLVYQHAISTVVPSNTITYNHKRTANLEKAQRVYCSVTTYHNYIAG